MQNSVRRLNWRFLFAVVAVHGVALYGIVAHFSIPGILFAAGLHVLFGWYGVILGYHHLLAHRCFSVPKWLEYTFACFGTLAFQGGPLTWVGVHVAHHAHSDSEGDPHNATRGFWWSHIGWMALSDLSKYKRYAPSRIVNDKFLVFLEKRILLIQIGWAAILFGLGGGQAVIYGVFVKTLTTWHGAWLTNSATHLWGYQNYQTNDARNLWWVALITGGAGWHNNHHHAPSVASNRVRPWELDAIWMAIWILERCGLAKNVKRIRLR